MMARGERIADKNHNCHAYYLIPGTSLFRATNAVTGFVIIT